MLFLDKLTNLVAQLGTSRDKASHSAYVLAPLTDDEIVAAYRSAWLPKKIVNIPAFDSVREWRNWQAKGSNQNAKPEANGDDKAKDKPPTSEEREGQIGPIEKEEKRLNLKAKVLEARMKARLWGGAAIMIGTGDARLSEPLDPTKMGKGGIRYLTVLTRRELTAGEIERDPASEYYGRPKVYQLKTVGTAQQLDIHPSRLVIFQGAMQPDEAISTGTSQGWGDSVLQSVLEAVTQADSTSANIASLVFEAKINIIRIPDFMANVGDKAYRDKLSERYTLAAMTKGNNGDLLLDKEEEFEQRTYSFSTLPDVFDRFMQNVAGAADIPATRLFGQAPAGMNATGESDLRNYYDRLSSEQELEMTPALHILDECLIRSALGARDEAIYYEWAPLWQMSETEKAEVFSKKATAARTIAGSSAGPLIVVDALSEAFTNAMIEDGSLPGLEAAVEKFGTLEENEPSEEEIAAAAALAGGAPKPGAPANQNKLAQKRAANDAAPLTLYVRRDVVNKADIIRWAKSQGFTDIVPDLHVTIAYSETPVDWFKVGTSWTEKLEIVAGGPRQMDRLGPTGKYIALLITASELVWRHKEITENGASWNWPDYQPHISIQIGGDIDLAEVEPYRGKIVLGPEIFEEVA